MKFSCPPAFVRCSDVRHDLEVEQQEHELLKRQVAHLRRVHQTLEAQLERPGNGGVVQGTVAQSLHDKVQREVSNPMFERCCCR